MASLTERLILLIDAKTAGAASEFKKLGTQVEQSLGKAEASAAGMSSRLKTGLAISATVAGAAILKLGSDSIDTFQKIVGEARDLQRASGATAEEASALNDVFGDLGVSTETTARGLVMMSKAINTDKLAKFGIEVAKNADGTTNLEGTLLNVVDAYNATADAQQKNIIATTAFGKAGISLIPILARGRDELEKMFAASRNGGLSVSQDDIDKMDQLKLASAQLNDSFEALKLDIGRGLVPILTTVTTGLSTIIDKASAAGSAIGNLPKPVKSGLGWLSGVSELTALGHAFHDNEGSAIGAAHGLEQFGIADRETAGSILDATDAVTQQTEETKKLQSSIFGALNAQHSYEAAQRAVGEAQERVGDARRRLNELMAKAVIDTKAVARAEYDLQQASESVGDAQERLVQAQDNLNKVRQGANPRDLAEAQRNVERALLRQEEVQDRINEATIASQLGTYSTYQSDQQRRTAALDLADAQEGVADAQDRLTELQGYGTAGSQSLRDAERQLRDAEDAVESAKRGQADAQDRLNDAQRVDPALSGQIQQAKRELRDAEQGVADAKWNVTGAALQLLSAQDAEKTAFLDSGDAAGYLYDQLVGLLSLYPELAPLLAALSGHGGTLGSNFAGGYSSAGSLGSRASGGPVEAGRGYKVHPGETFWPGVNGFIQPAGGDSITIVMPPGSDARDMVTTLRQYQRRNGRRWQQN